MASQEPPKLDYDVVKECLHNFESDRAGHGGLLLTRLYEKHPDLKGNVKVEAHGSTVVQLCKLLKAKGKHTDIIKEMATSGNNTDKFILENFRQITKVLIEVMEVMDDENVLNPVQKGALERVIKYIMAFI